MKKIYNFVFVISYFIVLTKIWCDNSQITKAKHVLTRKLFSECMFYVAPTAVEYFKNQFKSDSYSYTFCIIQFLSQIFRSLFPGCGRGRGGSINLWEREFNLDFQSSRWSFGSFLKHNFWWNNNAAINHGFPIHLWEFCKETNLFFVPKGLPALVQFMTFLYQARSLSSSTTAGHFWFLIT